VKKSSVLALNADDRSIANSLVSCAGTYLIEKFVLA